jgi:hypothetical protein
MNPKCTTLHLCRSPQLNATSTPNSGAPQSVEHSIAVPSSKNDAPADVEPYDRLGVTRAILWSLAIAIPFWVVLRWLLSTP